MNHLQILLILSGLQLTSDSQTELRLIYWRPIKFMPSIFVLILILFFIFFLRLLILEGGKCVDFDIFNSL